MSLNLDPIAVPWKRVLPFFLATCWFLLLAWWHRFVVMDDPWITFQYAKNLLLGEGLVFNPGERLEGYSNLTWVLLMIPALFANVEPLGFARLLGILSAIAMFALLVFRGEKYGIKHGGTAALLLAGCYPLAVWAMGGLETTMVALLVLVLVLEASRADGTNPMREGVIIGLLVTLLALSRPEGAMYAVIPGVLLLATRGATRRSHIIALVLFSSLFLVYTLWRWWYFGTIVANTVQAKTGGNPFPTMWRGFLYILAYLGGIPIFLLLVGGVAVWRAFKGWGENVSRTRFLVLAAGAALGIQLLFVMGVGGDWMPSYRFLVPALGPIVVLAVLGMERWLLPLRVGMVVVLLGGGFLQARTEPMLNWCRWAAKEAGGELLVEPLRRAGLYIRANSSPYQLLAATEAGVLPYHARTQFLDMLGLVDAHIAALPGGLHEKYDPDYILSREPDFVVLGVVQSGNGEEGAWAPDRALLEHPDFHDVYQETRRWNRFMPPVDYKSMPTGAMVLYERKSPGDEH